MISSLASLRSFCMMALMMKAELSSFETVSESL